MKENEKTEEISNKEVEKEISFTYKEFMTLVKSGMIHNRDNTLKEKEVFKGILKVVKDKFAM